MSLADATTDEFAPWPIRLRRRTAVQPVRRSHFPWGLLPRLATHVAIAGSETGALVAIVGPFDDGLVSWPTSAVLFTALLGLMTFRRCR
ncbi:hypothetical protein ABT369_28280 [Dactylosporangium sp. NPDC000244]|uniref:hypothetical protein n=1 Tax=Dactylosporangium sp. NPDC000244 TaxID=3154365 RepID=UPI0033269A7E